MPAGLYLGKAVDPATGALGARLELDPADLLTHGLIVGMTGSGKTGLAIDLLEELLRQGVPVLAIDPKGDLGNLLLAFEKLDADSFAPWIDADAATRAGQPPAKAAAAMAKTWSDGLAEWGLGPDDVAALVRAREAVIFTPGSRAGVPLNVLQSLEAPSVPFASAEEDLRDEISGIVAGLLGLVGLDADPLRSRESILLSAIIEAAWRQGKGLTLESLVAAVGEPPFGKLGALPVDSVFPARDRQDLMLALNNLLAAPQFEDWRQGEPLDVDRLLRAPDGRPRLSVVHTAHLSDDQRLFVTALLLDKVKTWMRRQGGTTQLRAVVYMDEVFGYFPPHPANPPTKRPLLTLLKQARAQGVGVVLATQNPVDLDYKGLSNMGVWMVGRLQTAQDRARLREGLLAVGMEEGTLDRLLDAARKRVFLLHDVHRAAPVLLHSRWAMSYLRGPLTRQEISRLMEGRAPAPPGTAPAAAAVAPPPAGPPVVPPPLDHVFLPRHGGEMADPHLLVKYAVRYKGSGEEVALRAWPLLGEEPGELLESEPLAVAEDEIRAQAPAVRYGELPGYVSPAGLKKIEKLLRERLPDRVGTTLWYDPVTDELSQPGEDAQAFGARLLSRGAGAEEGKLRERLEKKKRELQRADAEAEGRKHETWAAVGGAILRNIGLITGRKRSVSLEGAGSVLTKNRMENEAEARRDELRAEVADLERRVTQMMMVDPARFEQRAVPAVKSAVKVLRYDLLWVY
jgi:hypothetical protein